MRPKDKLARDGFARDRCAHLFFFFFLRIDMNAMCLKGMLITCDKNS